jgi:hypothetical protein
MRPNTNITSQALIVANLPVNTSLDVPELTVPQLVRPGFGWEGFTSAGIWMEPRQWDAKLVILTLNLGPHVTDGRRFSLPLMDFMKIIETLLHALNPIYLSEGFRHSFNVLLIFSWRWLELEF